MAEGTGGFDPLAQATGQVFLGDEDFVARVTRRAMRPSREVPKQQRAWTTLAQLARQMPDRDAAIRAAYATDAFTLTQLGAQFGLHYATVSRIARREE